MFFSSCFVQQRFPRKGQSCKKEVDKTPDPMDDADAGSTMGKCKRNCITHFGLSE